MTQDGSGRRIAYLTGRYPAVSHTFILREVEALRRMGLDVITCSVRRTGPEQHPGPAEREAAATTFYVLPNALNPVTLILAHVAALRHPGRWFGALGLALRTARPGVRGAIWQIFYFLEAAVLQRHLNREGIGHLHCHFADACATLAMLTSAMSGIPFSYTLHGPAELFEPQSWRLADKTARAKFVACISHFARSQSMYFSDPEHWQKIRIIHCGVRPELYGKAPETVSDPAQTRLVFVGRLTAIKGLRVLIEAFGKARETAEGLTLTIIGDGEDRAHLERMASPYGDAVRFLGFRSQDEVADQLNDADVLVLPSFAEGVPVVLMEAMASGKPVIATRVAGVPELVEDGESGLLVPPGDPEALAHAIVGLAGHPARRAKMGRAGREMVEREFDIDREAARIASLFLDAGGEAIRPGPLTISRSEA